jgi:predicted nuclease of predicted toxin-antitoxin system
MKFVLDAHLPRFLVKVFADNGHEAVHVSAFPNGYATLDVEITAYAEGTGSIVISKDSDFVNSVRLTGKPTRLLAVKIGNSSNDDLVELILERLPELEQFFEYAGIVELHRTFLVVHGEKA